MQKPRPGAKPMCKLGMPVEVDSDLVAGLQIAKKPGNYTVNTDNSSQCEAYSASKAGDKTAVSVQTKKRRLHTQGNRC